MTQTGSKNIAFKVNAYFKENWGSPFIVGFMLLFFSAAVSLSIGFPFLAGSIAVYAFCALVIGIALQGVCYVKYRKKVGEVDET